ncbi:efflux RND transporter periplasmic adaptor subunit [Cupriavidus sp. AU9028]|uniref:efflux RND transporter periplasmic adaptor subunit n=1 Tax=Cupriavidus sp. AU9028 TaxID=2871157 RepID=UPI001C96A432|nr:efflux RND transporter periplasmic adaptor subunit [Cupriavidus sp. AU9028]MBY4895888.1 efflux RND transporter periplasmic adaptor subunit [Cupriavidus sp. AU9028]
MSLSKKQIAAIAAIVVAGIVAVAAVLLGGRPGGDHDHGHDHDVEHAHAQGDDKGRGADAPAQQQGGPAIVRLTDEQRLRAAIGIDTTGPASIALTHQFPGEIRFNEDRTAHVVPRVAGVAEAVPAAIGQRVRKGEVLAVIASTSVSDQRSELLAAERRLDLAGSVYAREKRLWEEKISAEQDFLQARAALEEARIAVGNARQKLAAIGAGPAAGGLNRFELRAPFDGMVVAKHLTLGEAVKEDTVVFTISDLRTVWADFVVSAGDLPRVRVGENVVVRSTSFEGQAQGTVSYVGALLGEQTRTATARVTLANPGMTWRPGLFVTVSVVGEAADVPVSVAADAVHAVDGRPSVFVAVPGGFAARPVTVGRSDGVRTEIRQGLQPGERYAAANSFVLKAELGKASAEHTH